MRNRLLPAALLLFLALSLPALAEANYDGIVRELALMGLCLLAYLGLAITLLVLALRRRWHGFKRVAGLGALVALGIPLADTGLLTYQKARVAAAEIRADPADLTRPGLLYVTPDERCNYTLCEAMMKLRKGTTLYALDPGFVATHDFSAPLDLSVAPLRRYAFDPDGTNSYILHELDPTVPRPALDYVIIERNVFYLTRAGNLEAALPLMPRGTALGNRLALETLAAPIAPDRLDFAALAPDYLSFFIARRAFLPPLFRENDAPGSRLGRDHDRARADWFCARAPSEERRYDCASGVQP